MRLFVRCDQHGKIVSTSKVYAMLEQLPNPFAFSLKEGEQVFEIDAGPDVTELDAHEVGERYEVDLSTGKLRPRS